MTPEPVWTLRRRENLSFIARNRKTVLRSVVFFYLVSILTEISRPPTPTSLVYKSVIMKRVTLTEIWGGVYSTGSVVWPRPVIWLYELYGRNNIKR
jgi:hypothetical protein